MAGKYDEAQFREELNRLRQEVDSAGKCFASYEALNRWLANPENDLDQNDAGFWQLHRATVQAYLFMTLGRLFDNGDDALSFDRFLDTRPEIFAREALRARRQPLTGMLDEAWLQDFIERAYVPTLEDIRQLQRFVRPVRKQCEKIYRPLRTAHYAHRLGKRESDELFPKTNRNRVRNMLFRLSAILQCLFDLFHNGRKPFLLETSGIWRPRQCYDYRRSYGQQLRAWEGETERVLTLLYSSRDDGTKST
ncbi:MAG: hypothetical protein SFV18_09895 [Bryobacteraceae bacterium]|nr:hypothetical protein [Bryobacteraceae bacterium]